MDNKSQTTVHRCMCRDCGPCGCGKGADGHCATCADHPQTTINIAPWPRATGTPVEQPKPIKRPCDYGLDGAISAAEIQLGTIEAYNRLVAAAAALRLRIDAGDIQAQNPLYAVHVLGSY